MVQSYLYPLLSKGKTEPFLTVKAYSIMVWTGYRAYWATLGMGYRAHCPLKPKPGKEQGCKACGDPVGTLWRPWAGAGRPVSVRSPHWSWQAGVRSSHWSYACSGSLPEVTHSLNRIGGSLSHHHAQNMHFMRSRMT